MSRSISGICARSSSLSHSTLRGLPVRAAPFHVLRHQPRLWLGPGLRAALRHAPGPGLLRLEHRPACAGVRRPPSKRPFTKAGAAEAVRPCRRRGRTASRPPARRAGRPPTATLSCSRWPTRYGLRFNELRHLQTVDFATNPHARKFGKFGVCKVRFGKSRKGSPPKPRSVLTVFDWTAGVIEDWLANGRGTLGHPRPVPQRTRRPDRRVHPAPAAPPLSARAGTSLGWSGPAFAAPLLCHAPAGGRMGS